MIKEINPKDKAEFLSIIKESKLAVVDFFATWCGPCKQLKPKLEEIALANPDVIFYAIDIDRSMSVATALGIRSMPTVIFYINGEQNGKVIGLDLLSIQKNLSALIANK